MMGAFKKIGAAVGTYLAVDKIVSFGKSCVEAAATVQAQNAQFEATFKDLGGTAKEMFQNISNDTGVLATRLQTVGTGAFSQFKGAGLDAADALKQTGKYTNLAADAAAYYDMSLEEADSLMRSFIRGNTEAGDRIGLFTSETQRNEYALNKLGKKYLDCTEAEKQMIMLDIASNIYESSGAMGQASREADGYENVVGNLKESWKQFMAVVGQPILQKVIPILQNCTKKLLDMQGTVKNGINWLKQHSSAMKTVAQVVGIAAGAFVAFKAGAQIMGVIRQVQKMKQAVIAWQFATMGLTAQEAIKTATLSAGNIIMALFTGQMTAGQVATLLMTKAQMALNAVMHANPIGLIIAGITALIGVIILLWNKCDWFREFFINMWDGIKAVVSTFWEWLQTTAVNVLEAIKQGWDEFKDKVNEIWTAITTFCSTAWETIKNVVQVGIMLIVEIITFAFEWITLPWRFIWENCKGIIIPIWEGIKNFVKTAIENVKNVITTVMNAIKTVFSTVWNAIKSVITTVLNAIKSIITTVWNGIKSVVTTVVNAIKSVVTSVWNGIKSVTNSVFNAVKGVVSSVWNNIKGTISGVVNGIKSTVSSVWNGIKSTTSSVFNGIKSTATSVWNNIKSAITKPIEAAKNGVKSAIDKMKSFFNFSWSLPKIKLPHFHIDGKFSLNPPSIPHFSVDWYKKAMDTPVMFTQPTIFGMNPATGQMRGAGEAGDEVMMGKNTMLGMIQTAVSMEIGNFAELLQKIVDILLEFFPQIADGQSIVLDDGTLVGRMSYGMDKELGDINRLKERGA